MRGNVNQHIRRKHPGQAIKVIDLKADTRNRDRKYDYSKIQGEGIEEVKDLSAVSWAAQGRKKR